MCFIVPSSPTSGHRTLKPAGLNHWEHATTANREQSDTAVVELVSLLGQSKTDILH
jgi:hypothetical protein